MNIKANTTPPSPDSEPWVNTASACRHLGISTPTIRRWIKAGRLKPKRTPTGEYRFRRSELDNLLD
jgi:excisionase family DNA binding protein